MAQICTKALKNWVGVWITNVFAFGLKKKYQIDRAYIFIGLIPGNKNLYTFLQEAGFTLVFKETTYGGAGKVKGNCDADLVLKAVVDYYEKQFGKAIIVASDGDYAGLVNFFKEKGVLLALISPNNKCSFLLRKLNISLVYLDNQRNKLNYGQKEKAPDGDNTP